MGRKRKITESGACIDKGGGRKTKKSHSNEKARKKKPRSTEKGSSATIPIVARGGGVKKKKKLWCTQTMFEVQQVPWKCLREENCYRDHIPNNNIRKGKERLKP